MSPKNISLRVRLGLAFALLAMLVTLVAWLSLESLADANDRFVHYVEGINARALLADEVRTAVDRRAIAARNLVLLTRAEDLEAERLEVLAAQAAVKSHLAKLKEMAQVADVPDEVRSRIAAIDTAEQAYLPIATRIVEMALARQHDEAISMLNTECRPHLAALIVATQAYRKLTAERAHALVDTAEVSYRLHRNLLFATCLIAFGFAAAAGVLITQSVARALGADPSDLSLAAQRVATGDLGDVEGAHRAPMKSVLFSIGAMQRSLASLVDQVRETSECILNGSAEIASGNNDLSHRTEAQVQALVQATVTLGQLSGTVVHNAGNAEQASRFAKGASEVAARGGEVVGQVVGTMQGISDSSKQIVDIIAVIDGIAFQTNILALNAAVEASRAGEEGRGFAVVASEVRQLAQRSAAAAKQIKSLIVGSVGQIQQGSELVAQAGATMGEIVTSIKRVSDLVSDISAASAQQSGGVVRINHTVAQMDQATKQNAALVEESAAAAESLKRQALGLVESVAVFKL